MKNLIAVVDDEPDIAELVSLHLRKARFEVKTFLNGNHFYDFLSRQKPDLIILDLLLPDIDGLEICKDLKSNPELKEIPIIMLTAKGEEMDKILGLELGADDYVTKPFSPRELIARVKAVLRRPKKSKELDRIKIGDSLLIDRAKHEVWIKENKINLTTTEFKILELLASKRGWVFSREKILDYLWGREKAVLDRTVDVHIRHLRKKMGKQAGLIINIRGVGYKLET
jgi:two-component system phosphate regulon response regulator PhoB/two-component system alkaline phosphatase synthesis response regulator PhoP